MNCLICNELCDMLICPSCLASLRECGFGFLYKERCPVCNHAIWDLSYPCQSCNEGILSYGAYQGLLYETVLRFKTGREKQLGKVFAFLFAGMLQGESDFALVPIPASKAGLQQRGFDQMNCICRYLPYPWYPLLEQTEMQQKKSLSQEQRLAQKGFSYRKHHVSQKRLILLDDIYTTGSTMKNGMHLIAKETGKEVRGMTICKV
ncbi:MAG: phosphoribosyltransferase family protein [Sphaerochaetaceae bacterium]